MSRSHRVPPCCPRASRIRARLRFLKACCWRCSLRWRASSIHMTWATACDVKRDADLRRDFQQAFSGDPGSLMWREDLKRKNEETETKQQDTRKHGPAEPSGRSAASCSKAQPSASESPHIKRGPSSERFWNEMTQDMIWNTHIFSPTHPTLRLVSSALPSKLFES